MFSFFPLFSFDIRTYYNKFEIFCFLRLESIGRCAYYTYSSKCRSWCWMCSGFFYWLHNIRCGSFASSFHSCLTYQYNHVGETCSKLAASVVHHSVKRMWFDWHPYVCLSRRYHCRLHHTWRRSSFFTEYKDTTMDFADAFSLQINLHNRIHN